VLTRSPAGCGGHDDLGVAVGVGVAGSRIQFGVVFHQAVEHEGGFRVLTTSARKPPLRTYKFAALWRIAAPVPSVRENLSVLTSRAGFMASTPFSVSQENSIRMAAMCCLTVGAAAWRGRISIYMRRP